MDLYLPTLFRFACAAAALGSAAYLIHQALRRVGCREETASGWAFISPAVFGLAVFWLFPFGFSLYLSFTRFGVLSQPEWIGLDNYARIFLRDPAFHDAVYNTVTFAVFSVALGILSSLAAALLLNLNMPLMGLWRMIYYLPSVIPAVSTALLWRWIFVPEGGLLNGLLAWLGLPTPGWFADPDWVIPAFIIMSLQGATGNNMVIFLTRLRAIDASLYEASALDGAGTWRRFLHVTLPQLSPVMLYHVVMGVIGSLQTFTQPMFVETPGRSGLFYAVYIYRAGWQELRMGYAAALSWILFLALMALSLAIFRSSKAWVSYEESDVLVRNDAPVLRPPRWKARLWYVAVVIGAAVMILPIFWMVSTSLKAPEDLFEMPPELISFPLLWANYVEAWQALPFTRFIINTLFTTALPMAAEVFVSAAVAYGFARFAFPGRRAVYGLILATMMIPAMVMMIPVFLIWRWLGLVGTFDPLVLASLFGGTALFVFIAHQFFKTLPKELEEAARLDGASPMRVFLQIMLPQAKAILFVLALISFQTHWNDFLGPLLYLNRMEQYTMTLGLHFFQGAFMGEAPRWNWMMAMTTVMSVPTAILFLFTQRSLYK